MDIWKEVTLLLLLLETVKAALSTVILNQPPREENVVLGSDLTLNCSFQNLQRISVNWIFHQNNKLSCNDMTSAKKLNDNSITTKDTWSALNLKQVTYNDSGWYYCKISVEIPILKQNCSNGTKVTVTAKRKDPTYSPDWKVWVAVGVLGAILIILVVTFWMLFERKRRMRRENPIYTNMPPPAKKQPSPRPGKQMDNQKISALEELSTAFDNKLIRNPNPPRVHNCRQLRIPTPSQANGSKWSPKT
ncbi:uncharacterized protein LOC105011605 [Esox lucius]|uniref:uncharacterized protein LOC105011605 n=1 Tax=Esox lucius TaxID=8010 RepID=UPI001476ED45|nr:uncharacterized protein LOC105011605 [Esox lucius]